MIRLCGTGRAGSVHHGQSVNESVIELQPFVAADAQDDTRDAKISGHWHCNLRISGDF
jgi:hypothetical protein